MGKGRKLYWISLALMALGVVITIWYRPGVLVTAAGCVGMNIAIKVM